MSDIKFKPRHANVDTRKVTDFVRTFNLDTVRCFAKQEFNLVSKAICEPSELHRIRTKYVSEGWESVVTAATLTTYLSSYTASQTAQDSAMNLASCLKRFNVITFVKDDAMHGICGKTFQHEKQALIDREELAKAGGEIEAVKPHIMFPMKHGFFTSAALDEAEKRGTPVVRTTELQNELVQELTANIDLAISKEGAIIAKQRVVTINSSLVRAKIPVGIASQAVKLVNDRVKAKELILPANGTKGQDLASHLAPTVARYPDADVRFEMGQISSCDPPVWKQTAIGAAYREHPDATHPIRVKRPGLGVISTIRDLSTVELQYENMSVWSHALGGPKSDLEYLAESAYDGASFSQMQRRQISLLRDASMLKYDETKIYFFNTGDEDIVHFLWFNLANTHTGERRRLRFACKGSAPSDREAYEKILETGGVIIAAGIPTDNFASLYKKSRVNDKDIARDVVPTVVIVDFDNCRGLVADKAVASITKARSYVDSLLATWGECPFITRQHVFGAMPDDKISPCFSGHHGFVWIASDAVDLKETISYPNAIGHCLAQAQFCFYYRFCRIPWFVAVEHLRKSFTIGLVKASYLLDLHPCDVYWYARKSKKDRANIDFSDMSMAGMDIESQIEEINIEDSIVASTQPIRPSKTTYTVEKDQDIRGRSRDEASAPATSLLDEAVAKFERRMIHRPSNWKRIVGATLDYLVKRNAGKDSSKPFAYIVEHADVMQVGYSELINAVEHAESVGDIAEVKENGPTYLLEAHGGHNEEEGESSEDWEVDDSDDGLDIDLEKPDLFTTTPTTPGPKSPGPREASAPPSSGRSRPSPAVQKADETPI